MNFGIGGPHGAPAISDEHQNRIYLLRDYLEVELHARTYGSGVKDLIIAFYVPDSHFGPADEKTGTVVDKRYVKSRALLEISCILNHREVRPLDPNGEQLIELLKEAILATRSEVKSMGIKDFDVDSLYRDIESLIDQRGWITSPERYQNPPSRSRGLVEHLPTDRPETLMPENDFWGLIDESIHAATGSVEEQITVLEQRLSLRTQQHMVAFEATLWEMMKKSYHYNVLTLLMAVDSTVSENHRQHIRFRCRLILCGRDVFYTAIADPNNLTRTLDNDAPAERLLNAADNAFRRKFGRNTGMPPPRDVAAAYIDYDPDISYLPHGAAYDDLKSFRRQFAALFARYKKKSASGKRSHVEAVLPDSARIPPDLMIAEDDFWTLIQESIEAGDGSIGGQIACLEDLLARRSEKEIVGFELTLRELIRRSYHHNVVALLKAIADYVSDDTLLYFQCRLVLYGQDLFHQAVKDPNKLTQRLDDGMGEGEGLLVVADNAFLRKFGQDTDKDLPRDIGSTYYNYDLGGPVLGKPWSERTFAKRYAALLKLYQ